MWTSDRRPLSAAAKTQGGHRRKGLTSSSPQKKWCGVGQSILAHGVRNQSHPIMSKACGVSHVCFCFYHGGSIIPERFKPKMREISGEGSSWVAPARCFRNLMLMEFLGGVAYCSERKGGNMNHPISVLRHTQRNVPQPIRASG